MRLVIQRVTSASVTVDSERIGSINRGLLILVGIERDDRASDAKYLIKKLLSIRLWPDLETEQKPWSTSVVQRSYDILLVSQFTLYSVVNGTKPDFHLAMSPGQAGEVYAKFVADVKAAYPQGKVENGKFGADMKVELVNDGPVTILLSTDDLDFTQENAKEDKVKAKGWTQPPQQQKGAAGGEKKQKGGKDGSAVAASSDSATASSPPAASSASPLPSQSPPIDQSGLIFYFDINGTVTPIDNVDTEPVNQLINQYLAKNTYGHVVPSASSSGGEVSTETPSTWQHNPLSTVTSRVPGTISYYEYIRQTRRGSKSKAFAFCEKDEPGQHLKHLVEETKKYYIGKSTDTAAAAAVAAAASASSIPASASSSTLAPTLGPLFPSFIRVLHSYPHARIVFRTFGHDAELIVAAVQNELVQAGLPKRIFVGYVLKRADAGIYELHPVVNEKQTDTSSSVAPSSSSSSSSTSSSSNNIIRGDSLTIGRFIDSLTTDAYLIDDYHYWNSRARAIEFGKPIFTSEKGHQIIAFDDNRCMILPEATNASSSSSASLSSPTPTTSSSSHFVHVDPIAAMTNEQYFIQQIQQRLASQDKAAAAATVTSQHEDILKG